MLLTKEYLQQIKDKSIVTPSPAQFTLPEKVLQFGTGVLLRGLTDYFIDKANRAGIFNGRVVVVKSTSQGETNTFEEQEGLYTHCIRGIVEGNIVEETIINASISRVLNANHQWKDVLACANNNEIRIIISNTTEVGIQFTEDDIFKSPPKSFPGKLLAILFERFKAFMGRTDTGFIIIPTELIPDNGVKLKNILLQLAELNHLSADFIHWLQTDNSFCSSLVDRIVPGKPDATYLEEMEKKLGYEDQLMIVSEVYRLWAIEGNEKVREVISFVEADKGAIIAANIDSFRELKIRLLNGTHTLSCGLAFLSGFDTVNEAMSDGNFNTFISSLMLGEIAHAIPYKLAADAAENFGRQVLDRFRNPFIEHRWLSITLQYSSKIKMRCVPVILRHYQQQNEPPPLICLGFAAYLLFMRSVKVEDGKYYGEFEGDFYWIQDDRAQVYYERWKTLSVVTLVEKVLSDTEYWGANLSILPGFKERVVSYLNEMIENGTRSLLQSAKSVHEI